MQNFDKMGCRRHLDIDGPPLPCRADHQYATTYTHAILAIPVLKINQESLVRTLYRSPVLHRTHEILRWFVHSGRLRRPCSSYRVSLWNWLSAVHICRRCLHDRRAASWCTTNTNLQRRIQCLTSIPDRAVNDRQHPTLLHLHWVPRTSFAPATAHSYLALALRLIEQAKFRCLTKIIKSWRIWRYLPARPLTFSNSMTNTLASHTDASTQAHPYSTRSVSLWRPALVILEEQRESQ